VGGWRFPDVCGAVDPEADLWAQCAEQFGSPMAIDAVTSVKLPASLRQGVYRERPCDEQVAWLGANPRDPRRGPVRAGRLCRPRHGGALPG
jgi:hypothetical protein